MNNSQNPLKAAKDMSVLEQNKYHGGKGKLDIGTIITVGIVGASPFIFMGYVRFLVRRAEAHAAKSTNHRA
jgi:hypothetical protein